MGGKIISETVKLGRYGEGGGMGTDMSQDRWVRHGVPDIKNPTVEGASGIVFKGKGRRIRCKKAKGIEVVGENGNWLRAQTGKD